jgi:hypothetical protein
MADFGIYCIQHGGREVLLESEGIYTGKSKVWNMLYTTQRGRKVFDGWWK